MIATLTSGRYGPTTRASIARERGSTKVYHSILNDHRLSDEGRGLLIFLMSKPNGWIFTVNRIAKHTGTGSGKVRKLLAELEQIGYLQREEVRKQGRNAGFRIRVRRSGGRFALIPNRVIARVGLKALGVFGLIAAAPPGWTWRAQHMMRATGLGAHALRSALRELREGGFIEMRTLRVKGRFAGWSIRAIGVPKPITVEGAVPKPHTVSPEAVSPEADFRESEKRQSGPCRTGPGRPPSKKERESKKEEKKEDATLSTGGFTPPVSHPKTRSIRGARKPSPAFTVLEKLGMPEKYTRRWRGVSRNKLSRGAANGIASKWPEIIPALMGMSFSARLTAHATATWTVDVYRDAKEHGPERVIRALEKASRSRDPLATYKRELDMEPFEPMAEPSPIDQNLWKVLVMHMENINGPMTRPQTRLLIQRLEEWVARHGVKATEEAVRVAIERGWRSVYEPKPKKQHKKSNQVPQLDREHEVFGTNDPWSYPWPASLLEVVGPVPDPKDIERCRDWFWEVGEKALYAEHFGIPKADAERVCQDWGFKL